MFKQVVVQNPDYLNLVLNDAYNLNTYYMGMVDENKCVSFYDGNIRVVNPEGKERALFDPQYYTDHIAEWVEPWTYIRLTYLKVARMAGPERGLRLVALPGRPAGPAERVERHGNAAGAGGI